MIRTPIPLVPKKDSLGRYHCRHDGRFIQFKNYDVHSGSDKKFWKVSSCSRCFQLYQISLEGRELEEYQQRASERMYC